MQVCWRHPLCASASLLPPLHLQIEEAEYSWLVAHEAGMPPQHWAMAADVRRVQAYGAALRRAVDRRHERGGLGRAYSAAPCPSNGSGCQRVTALPHHES